MLILHIMLVLSTLAVVGVALVCYRHIRRHLHGAPSREKESPEKMTPGLEVEPPPEGKLDLG